MNRLMRVLAPTTWIGFAVRLAVSLAIVTVANVGFANLVKDPEVYQVQSVGHYLLHAAVVGGPLITFSLAVTMYQVRLQRNLWRLSRKDGLTGLNNRRTFLEMVEKTRARTPRGVLLMLDADWFKKINDTHGHQVGDRCLETIAYTLQRNIRQHDILGRLGGEEFAIYLQDATTEQARVIGERLTKPISFASDSRKCLSVTLSVGVVTADPLLSIDALFARADAALYKAKQSGRATVRFWEKLAKNDAGMLVEQNT